MKHILMVAAGMFFGPLPLIAVVTHKHVAPTPAEFFQPARNPDALALYDRAGNLVAYCGKNDGAVGDCEIEEGYTINDVMNAWLHAYEDK